MGSNFKILNGGTLPAILDMDFLEQTKMVVDLSSRCYSFAFAPNVKELFSAADLHENCEAYVHNLCGEAVDFTTFEQRHPSGLNMRRLSEGFSVFLCYFSWHCHVWSL